MMREVLERRFRRLVKTRQDRPEDAGPNAQGDKMSVREPGLIIVDGGRGQLNVARAVLEELGYEHVPVAAIAKGPDRNAGNERIYLPDRAPIDLDSRDPLLYFLQRLRDEAHRFVIGPHLGGSGSPWQGGHLGRRPSGRRMQWMGTLVRRQPPPGQRNLAPTTL